MNPYRKQILKNILPILEPLGPIESALDFGSGDGWFASELLRLSVVKKITSLDTQLRSHTHLKPVLYGGGKLPWEDKSFDLVYAIDVLHHCESPETSLNELLRCTSKHFLLKDHVYWREWEKVTLALMDEIGNRRFGILSLYKYQKDWNWFPLIEHAGFRMLKIIHPLSCHSGPLGVLTNHLQFIALWSL